MDGRNPGESGYIAMFGSQQACNWQNIISICYMPCLSPGRVWKKREPEGSPSHWVSPRTRTPPCRVPRALACGDRGSTGTAKLATVIKLMSCIGQGTARQWHWQLGRQPGPPGPGPRRRTQQARRPGRLAGPAAPASGPSRASGTDESRVHGQANFSNIV